MLSDRCPVCLPVMLVYSDQTVGWIKMKLGMQVGLSPGHIVLEGTHLPSPFSAHICCGQMARWIKMSLGMEVGLDLCDFVLDGDLAPHPPKGDRAPNFRRMSIVAKRLDRSIWHLAWRWASVQAVLC